MTQQQYIEYLIATPDNYTCTNLAEHLSGEQPVSHDAISDFLRREKVTPRRLFEVVAPLLHDSPDAYLVVDDSVQDKRYSKKIELVKHQYSGAAGGLVDGIGVVNLLHSDGQEFYPIDFRLYAPDQDGKSKNEHFLEMLLRAKSDKRIQANTVLFDSWYASVDNLKKIHRLGMVFVTTLKNNRLVSVSNEINISKEISVSKETGYVHLDALCWNPESLRHGQLVKLKELPFLVRLFKLVAQNGDIDWIITNRDPNEDAQTPITARDVQDENAVRWQIEQLHRELKQLVGTQKCQCRKARSQRNHLGLCYLAWLSLKRHAKKFCITLYAARTNLFREFLRAELRSPTIRAYAY